MKNILTLVIPLLISTCCFSQQAVLLADANPGNKNGITPGYGMHNTQILNDVFYYLGNDSIHGNELWRTDGTPGGTYLFLDINPGPNSSFPSMITSLGSQIFFSAITQNEGFEMWVTDGTVAGTHITKDINPGMADGLPGVTSIIWTKNNSIYFIACDTAGNNNIWFSDGTTIGTQLLKDINPVNHLLHYPQYPYELNNNLLFVENDSINGTELWITDGTTANTYMLADLNPTGSSNPLIGFDSGHLVNGVYYFRATRSYLNDELFRTDGTMAGTYLVKEINPSGSSNVIINKNSIVNNKLIFEATVDTINTQMFALDLATENIDLLTQIYGVNSEVFPDFNSASFFYGNDSIHGWELWVTDGTPAGTQMLKDIYPGSIGNNPTITSIKFNNKLLFRAADPISGIELWVTDGTPSGTMQLIDCNNGINDGCDMIQFMGEHYGKLFFNAEEANDEWELFSTDGTSSGTIKIDINPGLVGSMPLDITEFNGAWYISATVDTCGLELFSYDGSIFSLYKDMVPGPEGFKPGSIYSNYSPGFIFNDSQNIYLLGDSSTNDLNPEIWKTDLTTGQFVRCSDFRCGNGILNNSDPIILNNQYVIFFINTDSLGYEMWSIEVPNATTVNIRDQKKINNIVNVFPNPTSDILNLNIPENIKEVMFKLFDLHGHIIKEQQFYQSGLVNLSIDEIDGGFYFYMLSGDNLIQSGKIIKL